ncbi:hypothetical protein AB5I41_27910 [Sphingomonas sp. MMS24-JH45]
MSTDFAGSDFIAAMQSAIRIWSSGSGSPATGTATRRATFSTTPIPRPLSSRESAAKPVTVKRTLVNGLAPPNVVEPEQDQFDFTS